MTATQERGDVREGAVAAPALGAPEPPPAAHRPLLYLPALDGLRALAVTGVVLYHLGLGGDRAAGGYLGVDVFFVVSGYLITSLLLAEHRRHGTVDVRRFWRRRARRLLPAVGALVVAVCSYSAVVARGDLALFRGDAVASLLYVQNWHAIFTDQPYFAVFGRPSPFRHLWSLSIEEQFYLVWPVVLLASLRVLPRRAALGFTLAGAAVSVVLMARYADITALERAYYGTDTRAFELLIGAALAFVWRPGRRFVDRHGKHNPWAIDVVALLALGALLWQFDGRSEYDPWTFPWGLLWVGVLTVVLIVSAATVGSKVARLLALAPLVWIGRRSYSLYLWHWPVFVFTRPGVDIGWTGWPANLLRVGIAAVLAELSYRLVEQPFRQGRAQAWLRARQADTRVPTWRPALAGGVVAAVVVAAVASAPASGTGAAPSVPSASFEVVPETTTTSKVPRKASPTATTSAPRPGSTTSTTVPVTTTTAPPAAPAPTVIVEPVTAIGDSVMLGSQNRLRQRFAALQFDAVVARQAGATVDLVANLAAQGVLAPTVVVHMGNNGPIPGGELERLLEVIGDRSLVLVTVSVPQRWESQVNDTLRAFVAAHPEVRLVDWKEATAGQGGLTVSDGVHLTSAGIGMYVDLIAYAVSH